MVNRYRLEFLLTGLWLGLSQVALTFHLLYSQGASVIFYFALIFLWLLASVIAIFFIEKKLTGFILKLLSILSFVFTAYLARVESFTTLSLAITIVAVVLTGLFSGYFFKTAVEKCESISTFLLIENNGFIFGYGLGGLFLFYSIMTVDIFTVLAGFIVLFYDLSSGKERSGFHAKQ